MIGSLRGTLLDRSIKGELLIEVCGVGYRVAVSPSTVATIGELGTEVFVYVHQVIREDANLLYGFVARDERVTFEALLSAHGVGPALAMAILSVHDPLALRKILGDDDVGSLCLVPGVGRKTAARLLIELKSKLDVPDLELSDAVVGSGASRPVVGAVRGALANLGYGDDEIAVAVRDLPDGDESSMLREALRRLGEVRHA